MHSKHSVVYTVLQLAFLTPHIPLQNAFIHIKKLTLIKHHAIIHRAHSISPALPAVSLFSFLVQDCIKDHGSIYWCLFSFFSLEYYPGFVFQDLDNFEE